MIEDKQQGGVIEVTPEMVMAGTAILNDSMFNGQLEDPDDKIVTGIFLAMLQAALQPSDSV